MVLDSFVFEILIARVEVPNYKFTEQNKLKFDVNFNNVALNIFGSPYKGNKLRFGGSYEFDADPVDLRCEMQHCALKLQMTYCDKIIGTGKMAWPNSVLKKIKSTFDELMHVHECPLYFGENLVGCVEIIMRLQLRDDRRKGDCNRIEGGYDDFDEKQLEVNTDNDDFCLSLIPSESTNLDEKNPSTSWDLPGDASIEDTSEQSTCACDSKQDKKLQQLLFSITDGKKEKERSRAKQRCSSSSSGSFVSCPKSTCNEISSPPEKKERQCPICKEDITWLPKMAACTRCGYKRSHYLDEDKPHDVTLTAKKVIQKYMERQSAKTEDSYTDAHKAELQMANKKCSDGRTTKMCKNALQPDPCYMEDCAKNANIPVQSFDQPDNQRASHRGTQEAGHRASQRPTQPHDPPHARPTNQFQEKRTSKRRSRRDPFDCCPNYTKAKPRKRTQNRYYVYNMYKMFSTSKLCNRKRCPIPNTGGKIVPYNMGWLWKDPNCPFKKGWRPGAICKPVKEIMTYFLKTFPADTYPSRYAYRDRSKRETKVEEPLVQKPTLHIHKKDDEYVIQLRPLKDVDKLKTHADPYLPMKPLTFKIVRNPLQVEIRKLKRCLKNMGFHTCTCQKPVIACFCRNFLDKKRLEYYISKECRKRNIPCCTATFVFDDSSDSEQEYDFCVTPPVGVIKPERLHKPSMVSQETQYCHTDWLVPPVCPIFPNKYMLLYTRPPRKDEPEFKKFKRKPYKAEKGKGKK